ncbi:methyltransferase domain-containing protein [Chitinophaga cymbidii]|uniref:Methyltransferase domain-containing protein n=1 Tax=Chitinophaga cymbidii TaxID=1096750 RepID=A0A512RGG6_9BACT|nr:methyltransferase domain-containing protein [Chitinophaga cymbidii]GEP94782.1 hypothetical protein CCY01nite_10420 [Chitinophaga cymbidii]
MKLTKTTIDYLKGNKFSNAYSYPISHPEKEVLYRMDYIEKLVENKHILHLGCTDHIPLIKEKISKNLWFHKRLTQASATCLGIDIDAEAIRYVNEEFNFSNIIEHNIVLDSPRQEITSKNWDYMILGEIVEHLSNPCEFLKSIKEKYPTIKRLIITVPNAFCFANILSSFRHNEFINTDHKFWFTPFTLAKISIIAGYNVESFCFAQTLPRTKKTWKGSIKEMLLRKKPAYRDTLIMVLINE